MPAAANRHSSSSSSTDVSPWNCTACSSHLAHLSHRKLCKVAQLSLPGLRRPTPSASSATSRRGVCTLLAPCLAITAGARSHAGSHLLLRRPRLRSHIKAGVLEKEHGSVGCSSPVRSHRLDGICALGSLPCHKMPAPLKGQQARSPPHGQTAGVGTVEPKEALTKRQGPVTAEL